MKKFSDLSLHANIIKAIEYVEPTPIQQQCIPLIQQKHDVMARAQTGTGKTAAFALPLLDRLAKSSIAANTISVLVLVPTRELACQVFNSFERYGNYSQCRTLAIYGGVSTKKQIAQLKTSIDIVIATPGRLLDLLGQQAINLSDINTLVFDEADRILDLGFKDDIKKILEYVPETRQTLLFSATYDDKVFAFSKKLLTNPKQINLKQDNVVATGVEQIIYSVDNDKKRSLTSYLIGSKNWQQVLIFVRSKKLADELTHEMCQDGIKTIAIHGDKSQHAREKALVQFKEGIYRALVATDVAARGLDIVDLQYVINFELPYVAEDYVHRIGRTARAGKSGQAISLVSPKEEWLLTAIEENLNTKLLQQWFPGYEPDLTKDIKPTRNKSKKNARQKALNKNRKR